ncbi:hypothetical protein KY343_03335 [Candidatus Woesearchaeota archaeon]|nr:hypothetical protein [Candidatus Woesearchaeota archaeon]
MVTIGWCRKQKKGLKLIEPNDNLSKEYMQTAEETLDVLRNIESKSKVWLATTKYYCEYFAVYSLLMKIGIKCEIHDCTISICKLLEDKGIVPKGFSNALEKDKQLRIDNQYYLKNRDVPVDYDELLEFVLKIKDINEKLIHEKIKLIREYINSF